MNGAADEPTLNAYQHGRVMFVLMLVAALFLGLSDTVDAQADTSRRSIPRPDTSVVVPAPIVVVDDVESLSLHRSTAPGDWMDLTERGAMRDMLDAQRRIWKERRPREYLIRVLDVSHCIEVRTGSGTPGEMLRQRLVVRDTTIVRREPAPMPAVYEQRCLLERRADDLFAEVGRALADTTARIADVKYDAAYGFPRAYWIWRGSDRGRGVLVESFAPSP